MTKITEKRIKKIENELNTLYILGGLITIFFMCVLFIHVEHVEHERLFDVDDSYSIWMGGRRDLIDVSCSPDEEYANKEITSDAVVYIWSEDMLNNISFKKTFLEFYGEGFCKVTYSKKKIVWRLR